MKQIACGDVVPGCEFKARADTEGELLRKVSQHVRNAHPEIELTPQTVEQVRRHIEDKPA